MNNRHHTVHHWQLKNQNSWGCFNSTANLANSPQKWAKWAELAVLFSWQFQNGPHDFDFFKCHECPLFIWAYFYCPLSALIFHA